MEIIVGNGIIRPILPTIFSNGFESSDFSDWDTRTENGTSTCNSSLDGPRTGSRSLLSKFVDQTAYMLEGLSLTAREIEADFWLAHIANDSFGASDWIGTMIFEVAPNGLVATCGYGYSGGDVVPMIRIGGTVTLSTNFVMTEADEYRNWVARATFTKSGASLKLFIDGLLVVQDFWAGDRSALAADQFTIGYPTFGGAGFTCSDYIDDLVLRGRV